MQAYDTPVTGREDLFLRVGKDRQGYSHFRCPSCGDDLTVDPVEAAQSPTEPMQGRASFASGALHPAGARTRKRWPGRLLGILAVFGAGLAIAYLACR